MGRCEGRPNEQQASRRAARAKRQAANGERDEFDGVCPRACCVAGASTCKVGARGGFKLEEPGLAGWPRAASSLNVMGAAIAPRLSWVIMEEAASRTPA